MPDTTPRQTAPRKTVRRDPTPRNAARHSVNTLMGDAVKRWNEQVAACTSFAEEQQPKVTHHRKIANEYLACARELVDLIQPYAFPKYRYPTFRDEGNNLDGMRSAWASGGFGETYTIIGSVDYWAAALADDKFRQLCGSYAAVLEQLNLSKPVKYDLSGKLRKTDISAGKPEAHISLGFSRFFPHTFGLQRKLESLRNRLARDLDKRFRILIEGKSDQDRHVANQKAEAIKLVMTRFYQSRRDLMMGSSQELNAIASIAAVNPAKNNAPVLEGVLKLAYLKWLGFDKILVHKGEELQIVIDARVAARKTVKGEIAPRSFADFVENGVLKTSLSETAFNRYPGSKPTLLSIDPKVTVESKRPRVTTQLFLRNVRRGVKRSQARYDGPSG